MLFTASILPLLLAYAAPTFAGRAFVTNTCSSTIYVCITRQCDGCTASCQAVAAHGSWSEAYLGMGNSIGVTRSSDYYSDQTPKVIFGYSDNAKGDKNVYYSLNTVDGNPFPRFSIGDGKYCPVLTQSTLGMTKACADNNNINLSVYC